MDESHKKIIEVNGVKLEVDLRTAKKIEHFKVGDAVKVLVKSYGDTFNSYPGVIAGFDEFKQRPTITIAYVEHGKISYASINKDSKDYEICSVDEGAIHLERGDVLDKMDREINAAQVKVAELQSQRAYFVSNFGRWFANADSFQGSHDA